MEFTKSLRAGAEGTMTLANAVAAPSAAGSGLYGSTGKERWAE